VNMMMIGFTIQSRGNIGGVLLCQRWKNGIIIIIA